MTHEEAIEYLSERYIAMSMCLTLDECRKHNKAISMAIEALDKQILKKPIEKYTDHDGTEAGLCPFCNEGVDEKMNFCSYCGQAIDWSDDK